MTVAADSSKRKRRRSLAKKSKNTLSWLTFLPILVGVLVTPLAIHAASIMALSGPGALRLLYPFVLMLQSPVLRLPLDMSIPVSQWLMYLQFPLYGLLMTRLWRSTQFLTALSVVVFLHAAGIGMAYLLAYLQNPYLSF